MLYQQLYGEMYYDVYGSIFACQLFVSLIFFVIFQPRRNYSGLRACLSFAGYLSAVNVVWFITRLIGGAVVTEIFFIVTVILLAVGIFLSIKTNFLGAIYFATGAYVVQHSSYSLGNIIKNLFFPDLPKWADIVFFDILIYIAVGAVFFAIFVWPRRYKFSTDIFDFRALVLSMFSLAMCIILSSIADSLFGKYLEEGIDVSLFRVVCSTYAFGCSMCSVVIQFGFFRENKLNNDNDVLDQLIHAERKRHEMSKETINIINAKCHDMKHQLALLEKLDDKETRKAYINELAECIAIYDSSLKTGNDALDIVIAENSLVCEKNNISFSCLADGSKLSFMSSTDIAALFGNAFDNAIERQFLEMPEKRSISLTVKEEKGLVYVHMDNRCSGNLDFVDGYPQTTKQDKLHHGFGTKSICSIARKYNGEIFMCVENEFFNLDILFTVERSD